MKKHVFTALVVFTCLTCGGEESGRKVVLDTFSFWRCYVTHRAPAVGESPDKVTLRIDKRKGYTYDTSFPPAGWTAVDFDASSWERKPGPFFGGYGLQQPMHVALIALRGTFRVTDPDAAGELKVRIRYRGGVVLYFNGSEIARKNLPAGKIEPGTLADGYPAEVYEGKKGSPIRWGWGDPERYRDKCEKRIRMLEVAIPRRLLRKGVNVLAVEIHRAPINPVLFKLKRSWLGVWSHAGLVSISLTTDVGAAGVVPNLVRPHGLQVWNEDVIRPVFDVSWGDPNEPLRPIRIVGARRGWFSGQVVVGCDGKITGLKCEVTSLKGKGGEIDRRYVDVFYPRPGGRAGGVGEYFPGIMGITSFDALDADPPAKVPVYSKRLVPHCSRKPVFGAVQPVWVRVWIPEDTKAGTYEGELTIHANGETVKVPLVVEVLDWTFPERKDFTMFTDLVESPESVALRYGVELWSEEHWRLLEGVFKEIARAASKTVYIHCIARTNHGNSQSMVRWIRKNGALVPDFSIAEKYLDTALKCGIRPWFVIFYVHDRSTGGGYFGRKIKYGPPIITVVEPDGKVKNEKAPVYNSSEAVAFWKPVADGIRKMLKKRGLSETFCIGLTCDDKPGKAVVECWKQVAPEAKWVQQGHGLDMKYFGVTVGYNTTVWKPVWPWDPAKRRFHGWRWRKNKGWRYSMAVAHFHRDIWKLNIIQQMMEVRLTGEKNIAGAQMGPGRLSADFWPCVKDSKGMLHPISARYPENSWRQCDIRMTPFLAPGAKGAVSTVRFEMMVEGVQECEARIFLEKVILGDLASSVSEGEKKELQSLLDTRTREIIYGGWAFHWKDLSKDLFGACAKVKDKVAKQ